MADLSLVAWLGVFAGGLVATLWPWYNVRRANPEATFDMDYLISLVVSVLIAMPSSLVALALVQGAVPAALAAYASDTWFVFAFGILVGSGVNRAFNERVVDKGG